MRNNFPFNGAGVREPWLLQVNAQLQRAIGLTALQRSADRALLDATVDLPLPANRVEELVLGGLLLELALGGPCRTASELADRAQRLTALAPVRPGISIAKRAALHIRENHAGGLSVPALARLLGCDQTRLRRLFRDGYGMTLREYHLRSRVQRGLRHMAAGISKIGAVAALVGYSSDKNFYRVVRQFTGHTPGALRMLTGAQLREMADGVLSRSETDTLEVGRWRLGSFTRSL